MPVVVLHQELLGEKARQTMNKTPCWGAVSLGKVGELKKKKKQA